MNLLFVGDIFGEPGRRAVQECLSKIKFEKRIDFVIANGENVSHGRGINSQHADFLFSNGVDVITTGNHAFDFPDIFPYYESRKRLIRPANYPSEKPGRGYVVETVLGGIDLAVINLIGTVHMDEVGSPFTVVDQILEEIEGRADIVFVDMHAETTSETRAMGWHLDGRVAAVVGSHTHVQTADEEILPKGTAYITDAGMTGPHRSVIGMAIEQVLEKFRSDGRNRFQVATDDVRFCGVVIKIEESTGLAEEIERIQIKLD